MSIYNVSVIPQNLRREETIIQIAESLNYLSDVTEDIFKRINNRLERYNKNLNNLNERIDRASDKISSLSAAKNAIQVFSSSKYPAADVNNSYETIFQPVDCPVKTRFPMIYKEVPIKDEPLDKLQFFHITSPRIENVKSEGLGDIPKDVEYVNDLLLYNSGKNPYTDYVIWNTLQPLQAPRKQDILESREIGAAPLSISESATLMKVPSENYFYSPDLGEVPTIDVPIDLPDLPGIADDLRYIDEGGPGIAPSVTTTPNIPNLPQFDVEEHTTETKSVKVAPVPEVIPEVPPDLPEVQPAPSTQQVIEDVQPVVEETLPVIQDIPPPPEEKKTTFEATDLHANLMDAIRKAGGLRNAKLKSTETKETPEKKFGGNDLAAEFHAKLSLRRKGISGDKSGQKWDASSAMERISAMLIPPPAKAEQSESATTDEEWD